MRFFDFAFLFILLFGGFVIGVLFCQNYQLKSDDSLIKKCQETDGRYDFCQEIKQWGIK